MRKIIVIILVIILITCGCVATGAVNVDEKHCRLHWQENYINVGIITKFSVPDDNITCYALNAGGGYAGGLSCLKDDDNDTK